MSKPTDSSTVTSTVVISREADKAWQTIKAIEGCNTKAEALERILPEALNLAIQRHQREQPTTAA